ncbi:hypothetical protein R3W88_008094 [Solanum pinnatisectum]|uniref:Polyprotein protein n=1 Tax=Solanum pinnatisectum TaxID=50273 RepID=A0AAV9M7W0_9SOLN|nr:hypothetical protein R3W88_008094 [Solanum pinnatisectum]
MGHLAQFADVRASRVEAPVPGMIERAIANALALIRVEMREHRELINGHRLALDALTMRVDACGQAVTASLEIPPATTIEDVDREGATVESEPGIDEEELSVRDADMYDDLANLEGAMVETVVQASLREISMVGSS